jgi:hypothetical protein
MNIKPAFLYFIISILAFTAPITVLAYNNTNGNNSNESGGNIDKKIIGQRSYTNTTSRNKVYFSKNIYEKGKTWEKQYPDAIYEYVSGKDSDGVYLKIANFLYSVTHVDISTAYQFRK